MDISFLVILWVIFTIAQKVLEDPKKKRPPETPPPESEKSPDFEIPTLANDPNFPNEDLQILLPDTTQPAEVWEIDSDELLRQKKLLERADEEFSDEPEIEQPEEVEQKNFSPAITNAALVNAIILGEILNKPKFKSKFPVRR